MLIGSGAASIDRGVPCPSISKLRLCPIFILSAGFGPPHSFASGALPSAPSILCHSQAIPCMSSYSASLRRPRKIGPVAKL
jgi:hypothetical protein